MKKRINIIIIFIVIMMIAGCSTQIPNTSQQSKISSSLPASENTVVKDDAYYENLIKNIKYPEIYLVKSDSDLMDVIEAFVYDFDLIFSNIEFSSPQELGDNNIFYYLTGLLIFDEFPENQEIEETTDKNGVFFYKQETIEKYAYYFFNYKIDCTKIDGWSEEKQGIYRLMEGFGGGRADPVCDLKEIEPGKYQFTADYIHGEEFIGATDYTITAILGVEDTRVYLISLKRENIH
ncbi:MAG TPA: hypothetical protein PK629_08210 [Oscillospiraceae bacterium]|nr:hypothetical protein [Oscillospiraceae bacterium]HPK35442.1 hypothetical protein [Oscillospiraceae bacterium]HPR75166.1 hypothetical protein [Oscillospiraceae bacterium]